MTAGAAWPRLCGKVFNVCKRILEKQLSPDDHIIRLQNGFLILFATITADEAAILGRKINKDVDQFFIGDAAFGALKTKASHDAVKPEIINQLVADIERRENALHLDNAAAIDHGLPASQELIKQIKFAYQPIWDRDKEFVCSNFCIPQLKSGDYHIERMEDLRDELSPDLMCALEVLMLTRAQEMLINGAKENKFCVIATSVNYHTVHGHKFRGAYLEQLSKTPKHLRKFLTVCVDHIPAGAPVGVLVENLRPIRAMAGGMMVHCLPGSISLSRFQGCNISMIGFSLNEYLQHGQSLTPQHLKEIAEFCEDVHTQKAMAYIFDVDDLDQVPLLRETGVRYFGGASVGQQSAMPTLLRTLHAKSVFCPNCLNKDNCAPPPGHAVPCSDFVNLAKL